MKKFTLLGIFLVCLQIVFGQLTGIKTIPGDYPTVEAAITALNSQGVGSGGVTFNVAAGHTETFSAPSAGLITTITSSAANPIVFQKSGAGSNPLITAAANGTGTMDYILCVSATDYITFDGINVQENAANTTSTTRMEWAYAILKASATDGSQNVTIRNCSITLDPANTTGYAIYSNNHTPASTTQLVVTDIAGTNSNNKFYGLSITNCYNAFYLYGRADAAPYTYYDQNNELGVTAPNTVTGLGNTAGTTATYGFYCYYQNGVKIANNTFTGICNNTTGALYIMYLLTGTNSNVDVYNNTVSMTYNGTGAFYGLYNSGMGSSGTTNAVNYYNNNISNNSIPNHTSGTIYFIYISTGGVTANFYGNNVSNNTVGGGPSATSTGSIYYTYFASSPTTAGTTNMYNNTVSNNARIQSTLGSATTYIFYNGGSGNVFNEYNNLIDNITIAGSGTTYCLYNLFSGTTKNVYNNTVSNILNANSTVYGIYNGNGTGSAIFYNNKVRNLNIASASGTLYGVYQSSGVNPFYYNNYISELYAPIATGNPAIYGMYLSGAAAPGAFNNTVYLNASSTASTFGTTGIYASTTYDVTLRNNIVINNSTPGATGRVVAYQRSSTTLTTYNALSNNNDFWAGTPGASRLIYYDGTNSLQTLAAFKAFVSPRDAGSITELPPFVNVAAMPYNLHITPAVATQCESGGATVSSPVNVTTDFDGEPRYPNPGYPEFAGSPASAPDIGADEFGGILLDITPPNIAFSPLMNTSAFTARTLTTTITDASGVPTVGAGLPVLYWKINSGSYSAVTGTYVSGSTYTFTFGNGVVLGDIVSYYIVAQDLVTPTPNIGANPSGGAAGYTYNPPACSTPPTTPYSYTIVGTLAGTYYVGTGLTYPTLTAAIADLNLKEVVGPVTFELWDATYSASETFPLIIYPYAGMDPSRPVTFKPKAGVTATVTGAPATGILVLFGCDYVVLDGSNSGGTDRNLTFENTNTAANAYVIGVFNSAGDPASNCTIKNCNIKASSQVTNSTYGIILNAAGGGYNNIVIDNNNIFSARYGIQFAGVATAYATNGRVTNNIIGSTADATAIQYRGIVVSYADNTLITGNEIMGAPSGNTNTYQTGIYMMAGSWNTKIINNKIHDFYYTGTSGFGCYGIYYGGDATTPTVIANNVIYLIKSDGDPGSQNYSPTGIYVYSGGNIKIYHNSIYMTGATLSASYTTSYSSCISIYSGITNLDIRDNILQNAMTNAAGTGSNKTYGIYCASANTVFTNINYNDYFVNGLNPSIGYLTSARNTLAEWQAATTQDANSQNIDPAFVSATDLHFTNAALDNLGYYLAEVPADHTGTMRTNPPDMGAYEFGTNPVVTTVGATGVTCGEAIFSGVINANGLTVSSYFDYGTTTAYGSSIAGNPPTVTGTTDTPVTAMPTDLLPSTVYYFRARGVTGAGVHAYGTEMTFTTNAIGAPAAVTQTATNVGTDFVTLNGTVNANCEEVYAGWFEYGPTPAYGSSVAFTPLPVNGGATVAVSAYLSSLISGQTYNYRIVAMNEQGTTYGSNMTFTTGANPPTVTTNAATNIGNFTAQLNGTVNANGQSTTVTFQWGLNTSYGNTINATPGTVTGNNPTAVLANLSGLEYNTTYHFRCVGSSTPGTTYGADQVFTTLCPSPLQPGAITGPTSACQGTTGHVYTVPVITYATSYIWTVPAGGTIVAGAGTNSITVDYSTSAASGNVTVTGANVCGNGPTATLAVTLNPIPVPTISGADPACVGASYNYTTQSGMSGYVWTVSAGGQITAGAGTSAVTIQWTTTGNKTITVTYTSQFGCPAAAPVSKNVFVDGLPTPTIAGSNMMCANSGLYVYTTEEGFFDYNWTISGGGNIVSGQGTYQIEVNWTFPGNRTVSVNYENASGCAATAPATFAVTVMGRPGFAGWISGTDELCAGTTGVVYSVDPIQNATGYEWTVPDGAMIVSGENTPEITVDFSLSAVSGEVTVIGTNNCGYGLMGSSFDVTVYPIPPAPVVTVGADYLLSSSAPEGNQWYFEGDPIPDATEQTYQATEEGYYWTVVTLNGCVSEESNHVQILFVGMGEFEGGSFTIYPIPNNGQFHVSIVTTSEKTFEIKVLNSQGTVVYERSNVQVNGKSQLLIDLGDVPAGIYTLLMKNNDNQAIRKILVK